MSVQHHLDYETLAAMHLTLQSLEVNFRRACDQIVLMNAKLEACSVRYRRAKSDNLRTFRYPLRMRLAVIEGIRNMFYEYATQKATEVEKLRNILESHAHHVTSLHDHDVTGDVDEVYM